MKCEFSLQTVVKNYWHNLDKNLLFKSKIKVTLVPYYKESDTKLENFVQVLVPGKLLMSFGKLEQVHDSPDARVEDIYEGPNSISAFSNSRSRIIHVNTRQANISFFITADSHSWHLEKVMHNDQLVESIGPSIRSVLRGMYSCSQAIVFRDSVTQKRVFRINGLTLLPEFSNNLNFRQNPVAKWTCTQYMTIPILMGLLVAFMLLFVAVFGIVCIMDIRSVDRFDHPSK